MKFYCYNDRKLEFVEGLCRWVPRKVLCQLDFLAQLYKTIDCGVPQSSVLGPILYFKDFIGLYLNKL